MPTEPQAIVADKTFIRRRRPINRVDGCTGQWCENDQTKEIVFLHVSY
jgi:hypothetical protein